MRLTNTSVTALADQATLPAQRYAAIAHCRRASARTD